MNLDFIHNISPVLLAYHEAEPNRNADDSYGRRTVQHYELEYIMSGSGHILVNGIPIPTIPGSVNFRHPGMTVEGIGIYSCCYIEFDMNAEAAVFQELSEFPIVFYHMDEEFMRRIFSELQGLLAQEEAAKTLLFKAKMFEFFYKMADDFRRFDDQVYLQTDTSSLKIKKAIAYLEEHFGELITLEDLAKEAGYSTYHFCRLFKQVTGWTTVQYINRVRANHAKKLLLATDRSVEDISHSCGFHSYAYFFRIFKALFGVSPQSLRRAGRS